MTKQTRNNLVPFASILAFGFVIGYWTADDSSTIKELASELDRLNQTVRAGGSGYQAAGNGNKGRFSAASADEFPVTEEDIALTEELNKREAEGEYVLEWEWPISRKIRDQAISKAAAAQKEKDGPEYYAIFSELGISGMEAGKLQDHISKIHKASRESESVITQLEIAKVQYDKRLKSLLSDDEYEHYLRYEKAKPASEEYVRIKDYFEREGYGEIGFKDEETIIRLVEESQAYTSVPWHSPYSDGPKPLIGKDKVIEGVELMNTELARSSQRLLESARAVGLPPEHLSKLEGYYASVLALNRKRLEQGRDPDHFTKLRASRGTPPFGLQP